MNPRGQDPITDPAGSVVALEAEVIETAAAARALAEQARALEAQAARLEAAFYRAHPDG